VTSPAGGVGTAALTGYRNEADGGCWRNWLGVIFGEVGESRLPGDFSEDVCCRGEECDDGGEGCGNQVVYDPIEAASAVALVYGDSSGSVV